MGHALARLTDKFFHAEEQNSLKKRAHVLDCDCMSVSAVVCVFFASSSSAARLWR